eukprot:TRINITY_DN51821_c0_g1_i2.p2 TRINITY_DN51821_c0_g1~~TRINITY_DN51821_c0_g1_i2.p2  ORF type:complete len:119 (+),score=11.70 TRINITY_DN51821_c0_g1_i2:65-421(+)
MPVDCAATFSLASFACTGCFAGILSAVTGSGMPPAEGATKRFGALSPGARLARRSSRQRSRREARSLTLRGESKTTERADRETEPLHAGWQGFSMAEAREFADASHREVVKKTPRGVL